MVIVEEALKRLSQKHIPPPYICVDGIDDVLLSISNGSKQHDARPSFNEGTLIFDGILIPFWYLPKNGGWDLLLYVLEPSMLEANRIYLIGGVICEGGQGAEKITTGFVEIIKNRDNEIEEVIYRKDEVTEKNIEQASIMYDVLVCTMTFLNCRNIHTVDKPQYSSVARGYAKKGIPVITYKELVVTPIGRKSESLGGKGNKGVMPLHLCRGHIKTFTAGRPLFGRIVGQFFWHAQMRGKRENGEIQKDYRLLNGFAKSSAEP